MNKKQEIIDKYIDKWISQGRDERHIQGVKNFMSGQGVSMLDEYAKELQGIQLVEIKIIPKTTKEIELRV